MPFNVYLNDKLTQENVDSPHVLSGLNPATEYKLSVTEVVKGIESEKWNGKLITKQIVEANIVKFLNDDYTVIEGDTFYVEPIALPWNTTNREKITTEITSGESCLKVAGDNSFTAVAEGTASLFPIAEFKQDIAPVFETSIKILPQGTEPVYPTVFGIGAYLLNEKKYENIMHVAKWDVANTEFAFQGETNQHDWTIDITKGKDIVEVKNHGRRVLGLKAGVAEGEIYYVANPQVKVKVTFNVLETPVDFIFDTPKIEGTVGDKGDIKITYIPQGTINDDDLKLNIIYSDIVKVELDETDKTILHYELIGKGSTDVYAHLKNATRNLTFVVK